MTKPGHDLKVRGPSFRRHRPERCERVASEAEAVRRILAKRDNELLSLLAESKA